jgi:glycosyltransferase involved in cell wall biosynthesis
MIIGIDGNEANVDRRVGIGEYSFELLQQFYKNQNIQFSIYLKDKPLPHMPEASSHWQYVLVRPRKFWTQFGLPLYLFTHNPKPDVFFTPSHYAPRFSPVPTAIAIMDVAYLKFPQLFAVKDLYQLKAWTRYSADNAKKIFTISESSKSDIIKEYQVLPEQVVVTYPGIKSSLPMKELKKQFKLSENYVLFVGTLQPRKNIVRLIEAFSKIKNQKKDLQLVIVGKKGWQYEEILAAPEKFHVLEKVKFLDFVSDEDLPSLYTNALCYVLPSLYEGFGLPVLEAMQYNCPVITSNVSSLPEAGGDAALYVDPTNVSDIADKMSSLLTNDELRKELIAKGQKQIKKFSWEKTAKETLEVLTKIAKK